MKITQYNMIIDYQSVSQQSGLYVRIMYHKVLEPLILYWCLQNNEGSWKYDNTQIYKI